jgi:hypothetical protein
MFTRTHSFRADHPVFFLRYAVGVPGVFKSEYFYHRMEAGVRFDRFFRNFGRTSISLWGGGVSKHIPVLMLFNQSYVNRSIFFGDESKYKFNATVKQVYASHQYLNGFLYHDFGTLLYKTKSKLFSPRIAIAQSVGWSRLFHPEEHGGAPLYDMQKGYFESGVVIEDILRANCFHVFYFGFGGALYGAYGGSVEALFSQTLTPMIRLSVSF